MASPAFFSSLPLLARGAAASASSAARSSASSFVCVPRPVPRAALSTSSALRAAGPSTAAASSSRASTASHSSSSAAAAAHPPARMEIASVREFLEEAPLRPYARPATAAGRLVSSIQQRAQRRRTASLADTFLDKESSVLTGTIVPGKRDQAEAAAAAAAAASSSSSSSSSSSAPRGASSGGAYVGGEALGRIERSMAQNKSLGAKAGVRAMVVRKGQETAKASPAGKLDALLQKAKQLGLSVKLSPQEREALRTFQKEHVGRSAQASRPGAAVRIPAPPLDPAANRLRPLGEDARRLRAELLSQERRESLLEDARGRGH
jgi:hypothetical protein